MLAISVLNFEYMLGAHVCLENSPVHTVQTNISTQTSGSILKQAWEEGKKHKVPTCI